MSIETVLLLLPETILVVFATGLYMAGAFARTREGWSLLAIGGLILSAAALYQQQSSLGGDASVAVISGPLAIDRFAQMVRWLSLGSGLVLVMLAARSAADSMPAEFMGSLLLIVAGMMLVGAAADLVLMFLALELISIPTYVVLYVARRDALAQEAATKYFFLSILSSALLLYGFSFLYGVGGSTQLAEIYRSLWNAGAEGPPGALAKIAMLLIVAGLGFRITIVPFHFYAPDVYQGTTSANAGILAVVPKIAGLAALVRLVAYAMPGSEVLAWWLSLSLAVLTMTLGNVVALWQQDVRRMMAYSSIAHAGYMLIGLAMAFAVHGGVTASTDRPKFDGLSATMFYLLVYAVATAGTFAVLSYLSGRQRSIDSVDDLAGLARTHPKTAAAMALFMFSLTGLPPVAGFFGKFFLFVGALGVDVQGQIGAWRPFVVLAVIGVLNAAISAAYYLRIVAAMYFRPPLMDAAADGSRSAAFAVLLCAAAVIGLAVASGQVFERIDVAARSGYATFAQDAPGVASFPARAAPTNHRNAGPPAATGISARTHTRPR